MRVVAKIGTSSITDDVGQIDVGAVHKLTAEIAREPETTATDDSALHAERASAERLIDPNTAPWWELAELPGIGVLSLNRFGALEPPPHSNFYDGHLFRGCSHSFMFRLPYSLGPQVAPTSRAEHL